MEIIDLPGNLPSKHAECHMFYPDMKQKVKGNKI